MSELGSYVITAGIRAEGDVYPGNDTLAFLVQHYVFPDLALMSVDIDSDTSLYADLVVNVTNEGNIPVEELYYTYYLNDELRKIDTATVGLVPGGSTEVTIRLIGADDQDVGDGWHDFLIVAEKDSVLSNNRVSGTSFGVFSRSVNLKERHCCSSRILQLKHLRFACLHPFLLRLQLNLLP